MLANSAPVINGKLRYAINKVSYKNPGTPLKLADYFNIPGIFNFSTIKDTVPAGNAVIGTSVLNIVLHDFVEIIFQNNENTIQSYHLDGYDFWTVGYAPISVFIFHFLFGLHEVLFRSKLNCSTGSHFYYF